MQTELYFGSLVLKLPFINGNKELSRSVKTLFLKCLFISYKYNIFKYN
jgi:prophage maintenance system killer protein